MTWYKEINFFIRNYGLFYLKFIINYYIHVFITVKMIDFFFLLICDQQYMEPSWFILNYLYGF